jgi:signal transduction histidine kinase
VLWVSALLIGIGVALQLNRAARRESHLLRSLEEKELVYRMAVDNANVGIMDRPDVNAPAQNWSDQLYALLRFPLDTPPVPLLALVHHDQRSLVEQVHAQLSERAMTRQFQAPLLCGDGKYRWFSINAVSTLDPLSNTLRLSGAVIDIDEIKEAERLRASEAELARTVKELTVANSDLERFADMASHDLQEPLRMVTNFVSLLEAEYAPQLDSDAKEYIGIAYDAAHRMQIMLDDMLEYARSGRESVELTPVNLAETVETVSAVLAERIDTQGATIEHESLPTILADDPGMRSVLQNLISNALKYRHPDRPPVIRVGFRQDCERWFLTVTDNGMGIDVRNFVNIFKPFKRLHASSEFSGTGMGLALVHKTVQRWGGDIDVDSTPDCGSTFTISVPQPADHQLRGAA